MIDKDIFHVYSNAGYGLSVRGGYDDLPTAELKASRLQKKGHTDIEIRHAKIVSVTKFEAKA